MDQLEEIQTPEFQYHGPTGPVQAVQQVEIQVRGIQVLELLIQDPVEIIRFFHHPHRRF
jgi:hypothetical protein